MMTQCRMLLEVENTMCAVISKQSIVSGNTHVYLGKIVVFKKSINTSLRVFSSYYNTDSARFVATNVCRWL